MNLTQLEYFLTLYRSRNYSIAANQLFISQPALSRSISALENELGQQLIVRTTRKLSFTEAGEEFAKTCSDILHTFKNGLSVINKLSGTISGQVVIGLPLEIYNTADMEFLLSFKKKYPDIKLKSRYFNPNGLLRAMDEGFVDVIFSTYIPRSKNLEYFPFHTYQRFVAVSNDNVLALKDKLEIEDLRNECFFSQTAKASIDENEIALLLAHTVPFAPHIEEKCLSVNEILARICLDDGICILPEFYKNIASKHVKFIPLNNAPEYVEYFIWGKQENPCLDILVQEARKYSACFAS